MPCVRFHRDDIIGQWINLYNIVFMILERKKLMSYTYFNPHPDRSMGMSICFLLLNLIYLSW